MAPGALSEGHKAHEETAQLRAGKVFCFFLPPVLRDEDVHWEYREDKDRDNNKHYASLPQAGC